MRWEHRERRCSTDIKSLTGLWRTRHTLHHSLQEIPQSLRSFGMTVALAQKEGAAENAAAERLVYTDNPCAAAFSAAFGIRQRARHSDRREES
jgi:hypothetical protein